MDKDRFRFDLGDLVEGYQFIAQSWPCPRGRDPQGR